MLQLNENTRVKLMRIHGFAMLALGLSLFYIRSTMTNSWFYIVEGAFAMLLVAASLLFIAGVDWLCAAGLGRRQMSQAPRFSILEYSRSRLRGFPGSLSGRKYSDALLRPWGLCPFAQSGKVWPCERLDRNQAATDGHVHPGGNRSCFQRRPVCICRPGRTRCFGCSCGLFVV